MGGAYRAAGVLSEQEIVPSASDIERMAFTMRKSLTVNDKMQKGYRYELTEPEGDNFDPEFRPELTPQEMLSLRVFSGKYITDCRDEFPAHWFESAKLAPASRDCTLNYFGMET